MSRVYPSRASDPDFVPSLVLLLTVEEYSFEDVGLMFGVTRERARQWSLEYNIKAPPQGLRGMRAIRVWDDTRNRFVAGPRGSFYEGERRNRLIVRMQETSKRIQDRRNKIISQAVQLKSILGRDPTLAELGAAFFGRGLKDLKHAAPRFAGVWGGSSSTRQRYQAFRAALAEQGVIARKAGSAGWVGGRSSQPPKNIFCKRGHSAEQNKNKFGTCNICRRWTQKARIARKKGKPIPPEPIEVRDGTA